MSRDSILGCFKSCLSKYWVTRGRQTVKGVIKRCVTCLKQNSNLLETYRLLHHTTELTLSWRRSLSYRNQSIDLLRNKFLYDNGLRHERVNIDFPFSCPGIDYLGPLHIKNIFKNNPNDLFKVYNALYTYVSTHAVNLDLVPDASSRSFVNSLKRFIVRHGTPKLFISDNDGSFVGPEVQDYISEANIDWNFILDLSQWWGGFWERSV